MTSPIVVEESGFEVARVEAVGGTAGAGAAFDRLEERMESLRRRKMYGVFYPGDPCRYFACLRLETDISDDLGFERAMVPGGLFGRRLIHDWKSKISELPQLFDWLHADLNGVGYVTDLSRPCIEFYRRLDELVIMVPVVRGSTTSGGSAGS
jgi:hypothetical protein